MFKVISSLIAGTLLGVVWFTPLNPLSRNQEKDNLVISKDREIFIAPSAHASDESGFFLADNNQRLIMYWNRSEEKVSRLGVAIEPGAIQVVAGSTLHSPPTLSGMALEANLGQISAMIYDRKQKRLFFSEIEKNRVRSVDHLGFIFTVINGQCSRPTSLAIGRNTLFAACQNDNQIKKWNFNEQATKPVARLAGVEHVVFSRDKLFATQPSTGGIFEIDQSTPKTIAQFKSSGKIRGLAETRNQLIFALSDQRLLSLDLDSLTLKTRGKLNAQQISLHPKAPNQIAFSDPETGRFGFYDLDLQAIQKAIGSGSLQIKKAAF